MSPDVVAIPHEVADQLARCASERGVTASELAAEAIEAFLAQDAFEFVGSVSSDSLRGRKVDELLAEPDFGG